MQDIDPCHLVFSSGRLPPNSVWRDTVFKKFNNYIGWLPQSHLTATLTIHNEQCRTLYSDQSCDLRLNHAITLSQCKICCELNFNERSQML